MLQRANEEVSTVDISGDVGAGWSVGSRSWSQSFCWRLQREKFIQDGAGRCSTEMHECETVAVVRIRRHTRMLKGRWRFKQPWRTTKQHAERAKTSVLLLGAVAALRRKWITAGLHPHPRPHLHQVCCEDGGHDCWRQTVMSALFAPSSAIRHLSSAGK